MSVDGQLGTVEGGSGCGAIILMAYLGRERVITGKDQHNPLANFFTESAVLRGTLSDMWHQTTVCV